MFRLLQGDVGSGKTIVALISCFNVVNSGYQVAFMAPTEILAYQHYKLALSLMKDKAKTCPKTIQTAGINGSRTVSDFLGFFQMSMRSSMDYIFEHLIFNIRFPNLCTSKMANFFITKH